jgi:homoserine O-acetyltransferase/O-succinyltransferase
VSHDNGGTGQSAALTPFEVAAQGEYEVFELGDVPLQYGGTLRDARLAYKTHGHLSAARDNGVVFPTAYTGTHVDLEWLIGKGMPLDPERYLVICPNLFGMGLSSSPSNTCPPQDRNHFPQVSILDNVRAQHRLVSELFGIETLAGVVGFSMGALQAFQWAAAYPEMVKRVMPFCGSATTSEHNRVFLEAVRGAIEIDPEWRGGQYELNPEHALRHVGRIYAGWGLSQQYYWQRAYRDLGYSSLEDFLVGYWEAYFLARDANNLLATLRTWQLGDIGDTPGCEGDRERALGRITARAIVLPAEKDLYFPPEDQQWEVSQMPNAELRVIPGIWGHFSCVGIFPEPAAFIAEALHELLTS